MAETRDVVEIDRESLLAAIVQSTDAAVVSQSPSGIITSWNRGAAKLFGYSAAEAIGQPSTMLMPVHRLREDRRVIDAALAGRRPEGYETDRLRQDGTQIRVWLTVSPMEDEVGAILGVATIVQEVAAGRSGRVEGVSRASRFEESATAQALVRERQISARMREMDRLKDEFLSTVAHELRTPLTALSGFAEIVARDEALDDDTRRHFVDQIGQRAQEMLAMIDQLLDFSRLQAGKVAIGSEPVELEDAVAATVVSLTAALSGHHLDLGAPLGVPVKADLGALERILSNLLTNAAKFSPPGSTIHVRAWRDGPQAVVSVRDEGIGIAPDDLPRVFERYYQGSGGQAGTGLGLSIARRYVELLGGTISVSSEPSKGATFSFRLPVASF